MNNRYQPDYIRLDLCWFNGGERRKVGGEGRERKGGEDRESKAGPKKGIEQITPVRLGAKKSSF
jgi:hypothetical protein